jgi:nitrite reductase/ring-hydroxylating ferredoxin subunit
MVDFIEAGELDSLPPGRGAAVTVGNQRIAIFNVDGTVYAIEDRCLHQSALLSTGDFSGKIVTCRKHGWKYDVTTGNVANVPGFGVTCYDTKVSSGKILVATVAKPNESK